MNTLVKFMGVYPKKKLDFWVENTAGLLRLDWKKELRYILLPFLSLLEDKGLVFCLKASRIKTTATDEETLREKVVSIPMTDAFSATSDEVADLDEFFDAEDLVFYLVCKDKNNYRFEIRFHFTTFLRLDRPLISKEEMKPTICLEVQICSDKFSPSVNDAYVNAHSDETLLEAIKFTLLKQMKKDWEKVIWMVDKESEVLSEDLYLDLFHFETRLRQALAYMMSRFFDSSDEFVKKPYHVLPKFDGIDTRFFLEFGKIQWYILDWLTGSPGVKHKIMLEAIAERIANQRAGLTAKQKAKQRARRIAKQRVRQMAKRKPKRKAALKLQGKTSQMAEQMRKGKASRRAEQMRKAKVSQMAEQVRYVSPRYGSVRKWVERYFCKEGQQPDKISVGEINKSRKSNDDEIAEIEAIRQLRNKIAHYAPITNAYYHQQKELLDKLNQKLSVIIDRMERDNVSAAQGEQRVLDAAVFTPMLKN